MLKFYILKKRMYLALQIIVPFLQIILFLTIFSVSLYWFFELLNLHIIDFMQPVADFVRGFTKLFYKRMIVVNNVEVDGSILLFDIIAVIVIIAASHVNMFLKTKIREIDIIFDKLQNVEEEKFNQQLETNYESKILKKDKACVLISYSLKNSLGSAFWTEKEESLTSDADVNKQIYLKLAKLPGVSVSKSGTQFLILYDDIKKTDTLLYYLNILFAQAGEFFVKRQVTLTFYTAIHAYDDETDIKHVFTLLNRLLSLKISNEIVCLNEFKLRYELLKGSRYSIQPDGEYYLPPNIKVYSVVKKY